MLRVTEALVEVLHHLGLAEAVAQAQVVHMVVVAVATSAAAMADLPDAGYLKFCCIEAAIANDRAEIVMPGGSHVLMTRISVEE